MRKQSMTASLLFKWVTLLVFALLPSICNAAYFQDDDGVANNITPDGIASNPSSWALYYGAATWDANLDTNDANGSLAGEQVVGSIGDHIWVTTGDPTGYPGGYIEVQSLYIVTEAGYSAVTGNMGLYYSTDGRLTQKGNTVSNSDAWYTYVTSSVYTEDSKGGALDLDDINNLQLKISRESTAAGGLYVSQLVAVVQYTTTPTGNHVDLDVSINGSGAVTASEGAIDCDSGTGICTDTYNLNKNLTLTAAPAGGYSFSGWSGGGCSGTAPCDVTMSSAKSVTATFNAAPVGGYTADNVIPAAQVSQSTAGDGLITINFRARDADTDNVTLETFEYSVDGGSTWNAPTNGDASGALSTNWTNNGGGGYTSAADWSGAVHSFTFDTDHADVAGMDGVDQSDVQVRFTLNDGTDDSASSVTSESFQVDDLAPTATIASASYDADTDTMVVTGTDFDTIAVVSTDIKSYVDWTKFVWDINGDDATTANVTFIEGDVTSLTVTDATTLTMVLTSAKGTALEGTAGYGATSGADTLDVTAGFSKDAVGNAATTDAVSDGPIGSAISGTVYTDEGITPIADGTIIRLIVNGVSIGITTTTGGNYSISPLSLSAGDAIIVYIDTNATDGTTVTVVDGSPLAGLDIYGGRLITRNDNGDSLTNALMNVARGAYSDVDILYYVNSGNLVASPPVELYIPTGHTFVPGGTVTVVAGGGVDIDGTLNTAANLVNVAGSWDATGGVFNSSGTVTFKATSGTNTVTPGGTDADHDFQNIVFNDNGGSATFELDGAINVVGNFTVTDGIVDTKSGSNYGITVGGNFSQAAAGQVEANGSTITVSGNFSANGTIDNTDYNSASLTLNGTGTQSVTFNGSAFNNLTVTNNSAIVTFSDAFTTVNFTATTADSQLTFTGGVTYTISGTLDLDGQATDTEVILRSTNTSQYIFDVTGGAQAVSYVDVQYAAASSNNITATNSINSGNNDDGSGAPQWIFGGLPTITVTKLSLVISDPINGGTNPKRIPGAVIEYSIVPSNTGDGSPDADSTFVTDIIDTDSVQYDVDTGISFTDGATSSGLALDAVSYADDAAPGPYTYDYTPVPDGNGYDSNVTSLKVTTTGTFASGGTPAPSFTLKYRGRIK